MCVRAIIFSRGLYRQVGFGRLSWEWSSVISGLISGFRMG